MEKTGERMEQQDLKYFRNADAVSRRDTGNVIVL